MFLFFFQQGIEINVLMYELKYLKYIKRAECKMYNMTIKNINLESRNLKQQCFNLIIHMSLSLCVCVCVMLIRLITIGNFIYSIF